VAVARARCLYCGAELPEDVVPTGPTEASPTLLGPLVPVEKRAGPERVLIVLDITSARAERLAEALDLSAYEADLLARRGGFHLHRILDADPAEAEAERLRKVGMKVKFVPESEVRAKPLRALGGERGADLFDLRTEEGPLSLGHREIILVVQGAIARQYQPTFKRRRVDVASLEEGFRVHFHRRSDPRPVELDAANFEFGLAATGSSRLELDAWIEGLGDDLPRDDGFRLLPPAFGVAAAEARGPLAAATALRGTTGRSDANRDESVLLDNAQQFIFYSAWRGALARLGTKSGE
jgi:hypothetical protein